MSSANTLPNVDDDRLKALIAASGGMPSVSGAAAPPVGIPSVDPSLAKPTPAQSRVAGKAEYASSLPAVTAQPFTPEYYQQQRSLSDFKAAHPLGSDISARPGIVGKIEHGLAKVGNIAGDIVAPGAMAMIPGTDLYNNFQRSGQQRGFTAATENEQRQAQTEQEKEMTAATAAGNQPTEWTPPGSTVPMMVPAKSIPTLEAAEVRASEAGQAAQTKNAPALAKLGLKYDNDGNVVPMEESELSPELRQSREFQGAAADLKKAQTALANSKNDPNSAAYKLEQAKVDEARERTQQAASALGLHQQQEANKEQEQQLVKPSGQTVSRGGAAGAALQLLPGLEEEVRKNGATMGPILGRIRKGEIKLGNVDPATQKLYSQLESFYAMQPAIHGFRNAEFVKDFDTFIGNLQTNPAAVIAGLEGLKPTLEAVEKSGRTYTHRIVEGQGEGGGFKAPEGAPSAQGVPDGKVLKDGTGKIVARASGGQWTAP